MSIPKINPTTQAKTVRFYLKRDQVPARLSATGLAGSETVALKVVDGYGGAESVTAAYKDGAPQTLKATDPVTTIVAPGGYEITKSATAAASGVYLAHE